MSVRNCINQKVMAGRIARDIGQETLDLFDELYAENLRSMGTADADLAAGNDLARIMAQRAEEYRRQGNLKILKDKVNLDQADRHSRGIKNGFMALVDRDIYDEMSDVPNVTAVAWGVLGDTQKILFDAVDKFRRRAFKFGQDEDSLKNWLKGIYGDPDASEEGRAFASAWRDAVEYVNRLYVEAGGIIPERADWRLPNPLHDQVRIRNTRMEDWIAKVSPLLNREQMVDLDTGRPLNDLQLQIVLTEVYETLASGGLSKLRGQVRGGQVSGRFNVPNRMRGRRYQNPRILHFKDSDAWLEYNEAFGDGDLAVTLFRHMENMANDVGLLQVFGPDPDASVARFADLIRQQTEKEGRLAEPKGFLNWLRRRTAEGLGETAAEYVPQAGKPGPAAFGADHFLATYRLVSGQDRVVNESLHGWSQSVRSLLVGQQLGSAMLTAISDFGFMKKAAEFNDLSAAKAAKFYLRQMNPKNADDRRAAAQLSLVVEDMLASTHAASRYVDGITASRFAGKFADSVMRLSGLAPHTQSGRTGFGMMIYGELAANRGKAFGDLDDGIRRMLARYGIQERQWDIARSAQVYRHRGEDFMSPDLVNSLDNPDATAIATSLKQMVFQEMNFAVPTSTARVNALLALNTLPGTPEGEMFRFLSMYKRFPVLIVHTHLVRALFSREGSWVAGDGRFNKGLYLANLAAYTTFMGGLALQLNDIASGKDPREIWSPEFAGAALLKGGALGFFADFLYAGLHGSNQYGRGLLGALAGPGFGLAEDVVKLTFGNVGNMLDDKPTNFGRELVLFTDRYLVPGTSIWWSKLALERLVTDQLLMAADPKASRRFARLERIAKKERDQRYWWGPGDITPARPPNLARTIGG